MGRACRGKERSDWQRSLQDCGAGGNSEESPHARLVTHNPELQGSGATEPGTGGYAPEPKAAGNWELGTARRAHLS